MGSSISFKISRIFSVLQISLSLVFLLSIKVKLKFYVIASSQQHLQPVQGRQSVLLRKKGGLLHGALPGGGSVSP